MVEQIHSHTWGMTPIGTAANIKPSATLDADSVFFLYSPLQSLPTTTVSTNYHVQDLPLMDSLLAGNRRRLERHT